MLCRITESFLANATRALPAPDRLAIACAQSFKREAPSTASGASTAALALAPWEGTPLRRLAVVGEVAVVGDIALFAHGHLLRVLAARWIGLPASGGQHFLLNAGTLCVLGYYHEIPAVRIWNGPLSTILRGDRAIRKLERQ